MTETRRPPAKRPRAKAAPSRAGSRSRGKARSQGLLAHLDRRTLQSLAALLGFAAFVVLLANVYGDGSREAPGYTAVAPAQPEAGEEELAELGEDAPTLPREAPTVPQVRTVPEPAPVAPTPAPPAPEPARQVPTQTAMLPPPVPPPAGTPLWKRNAVPAPAQDGRPRIVIVIDDMGPDRKRSDRAAALPGPLTLAWLPYARDLPHQAAAARRNGHELIVHMPMEPDGKGDPGRDAILTKLPAAEIKARIARNLAAFDGYVGINNHMGSRFTANTAGMAVVMAELSSRGLLFLDSRTTAQTKAPELAPRYHVPLASRDVFLDHEMTPAAVEAALAKVEAVARTKGTAIAIGHPHDVTVAALERWLPTLSAKGFQLVPLTATIRAQPPAS
ncbi:divergent polysaccharide deacetylase family protein [Aerophototrophica crusticola]|uniref:Divergent polysaccharide deacetylase family protein n=1 Tax=Aerophototrophica crusticola TaxID=1709002 RepID=A0A858R6I0_9PROT|nr:divergent polysaccharide deacetylase family protein [Rhodospirillaceae bacterium B3]